MDPIFWHPMGIAQSFCLLPASLLPCHFENVPCLEVHKAGQIPESAAQEQRNIQSILSVPTRAAASRAKEATEWLGLLAAQGLPVSQHLFPHPNETVSFYNGRVSRVMMKGVRKKHIFLILFGHDEKMGSMNTAKPRKGCGAEKTPCIQGLMSQKQTDQAPAAQFHLLPRMPVG